MKCDYVVCNSVRAVFVGVLITDPKGRTPPFRRLTCILLLSFHVAQLTCSYDLLFFFCLTFHVNVLYGSVFLCWDMLMSGVLECSWCWECATTTVEGDIGRLATRSLL